MTAKVCSLYIYIYIYTLQTHHLEPLNIIIIMLQTKKKQKTLKTSNIYQIK
jgi:hypothetical protein